MYRKQDATMTKGMAVLCMVLLHLFCRKGTDVYGAPLLWLTPEKPFVYWIGFYSEICVQLFSLCAGYALYRNYNLSNDWHTAYKSSVGRLPKLLLNYWIVLCLFSGAGLLYKAQDTIPGSLGLFVRNAVLLNSYNGAWWYLNTYFLLTLLSPLLLWPIRKLSGKNGVIVSFCLFVLWYLVTRFNMVPLAIDQAALAFLLKEGKNLFSIIPAVWIGAIFCKDDLFAKISNTWGKNIKQKSLLIIWIILFVLFNLIEKAVLVLLCAVITIILFNLWRKPKWAERTFLILGKHSTNIWLTHMFFYLVLFKGLVQKAVYPVLMLLFILILCITTSYIVMAIQNGIMIMVHQKHDI